MENDVLELVEMLYTMVTEAWGVPLGNEKCIVERDKVLNLLDEIKAQLPAEVAEQEIVRAAKTRSNEVLAAAENRTRELYRVANEYVDDALRRTEEAINSALSEVRQSRSNFRAAAGNTQGQKQNASVSYISQNDLDK